MDSLVEENIQYTILTEPVVESVTVTEPVIEPVVESVTVTESVIEPVVESVTVTEPVIEPVVESVTVTDTEPAIEPVAPSHPTYENNNIEFQIVKPNTEPVDIYSLLFKSNNLTIPVVIFIVPYRDREKEKACFEEKMTTIMQDYPIGYYKIYYIQQNFDKPFNRGAMKNIGFLMVKTKYPNDYKNITLVFNDIDTMPVSKTTIPSYSTQRGVIKHFYGYNHVLGGIVSILGGDFELTNGFPNYYSWGFEDNELNYRVKQKGLIVDRSVFYQIGDSVNIIQLGQSLIRVINSGEFSRYARKVNEGINTIYDLLFSVNETTGVVDVKQFQTGYNVNESLNKDFDTAKSNIPFRTGYSAKKRCSMNLVI